jgi:hypothetical protein
MKIMKKLFYRRFSKEECKQIMTIFYEETKVMMKRPQYIIGHALIMGMLFYFLVRAFGPENFREFKWPSIAIIVGATAGTSVFLLGLKIFKMKNSYPMVFFGLWMFAFFLLTGGQRLAVRWEFLLYAFLTLFGVVFCTGSIKEHLIVIPAQAGIQTFKKHLDTCFRRYDKPVECKGGQGWCSYDRDSQ